jgi:hypothetical protein
MLFAAKTKGFFVQQTEHALMLARTSEASAPLVIEELMECAAGDSEALAEAKKRLQPKKSGNAYLNASCGVGAARQLMRRATLEVKRLKEPNYLNEILTTQFRVEPEKYTIHVLNSTDGTDFDPATNPQKEVIFCGLPSDDVVAIQDSLLESGIYPERIELGTLATLGGVVDYLKFNKSKTPTLVLEMDGATTHSFIVTASGVEATRPIAQGLESMVPIVQKELGLKDEESAKKLFYSNTFDFTGMGPVLTKKLLKELQSSIGFYEVQTGQSVGQVICTSIPRKLAWIETVIANALGISLMNLDLVPWLLSRKITIADGVPTGSLDARWFGLMSLMIAHTPAADAAVAEKKE